MFAPYLLLKFTAHYIATKKGLVQRFSAFRTWMNASPWRREVYHCGHWTAHVLYFGAVFVEGHGLYAFMGLVMVTLMFLAPFFGSSD